MSLAVAPAALATAPLFAHQERQAQFHVRNKFGIAWAAMGAGKTRGVVEAANRLGLKSALVPCPAIALVSWQIELRRWAPHDSYKIVKKVADLDGPERWKLISYDMAVKFAAEIEKRRFDVLVIDEVQYLKNPGAKRTRAFYGRRLDGAAPALVRCAPLVWGLTGTLTPNSHAEAWVHCYAMAPHLLPRSFGGKPMGYAAFIQEFCLTRKVRIPSGHVIEQVVGSKNVAQFQELLRPILFRVTPEQLALSLPPLTVRHSPLALRPGEQALLEEIDLEIETLAAELGLTAAEALAGAGVESAGVRRRLGLLKARAAVEHAENILESSERGEKLLLFFAHTAVGDTLEKGLESYGTMRIDGSTTLRQREIAITAFQESPDVRVAVLQVVAASTAITLHSARFVGLVEPSFTPATNNQAIGRAHRTGQTRPVVAEFLYAPNSYDEQILEILATKSRTMQPEKA